MMGLGSVGVPSLVRWTVVYIVYSLIKGALCIDRMHDFRFIPYSELSTFPSTVVYSNSNISTIQQVVVHVPGHQVILGARNYLVKLDLSSLAEQQVIQWAANEEDKELCSVMDQSQELCHNFIQVLLLHTDQVFACGTNAFNPKCTWRPLEDLSRINEVVPGVAICPHRPLLNTTSLMLHNGDLYSATFLDFLARDPAISRLMGPSKPLRTVQHNSNYFNDPNFVSSYEIGDYVYMFFRETGIEVTECAQKTISRAARLCKHDDGGKFLLDDNWTTFMKTRLNCSQPGTSPFPFEEIQGTYMDLTSNLVYAVFTTAPNSIYGSAVCAYHFSAFQDAFSGPFLHREGSEGPWMEMPNSLAQSSCENSTVASGKRSLAQVQKLPSQRLLMDAQKFQLMAQSVQPIHNRPLLTIEGQRYSHLVVDQVMTKHHPSILILFLTTFEGKLQKYASHPSGNMTCLVEELQLTTSQEAVTDMRLLKDDEVLLVSLGSRFLRLPWQRCHRHQTEERCYKSQDPYCGWDSLTKKCSPPVRGTMDQHWHQNIQGCPQLDITVHGQWSSWSSWQQCSHGDGADTSCLCRQRRCDDPAPQHGGQACVGSGVQVTNCTVHGAWTQWSPWSGCSVTCGQGSKERLRYCTNPEPTYGGRVCVGHDKDVTDCSVVPCSYFYPTDFPRYSWSDWSSWTECPTVCGQSGEQVRQRQCSDSGRPALMSECSGSSQEIRKCPPYPCPRLRENSGWTDWIVVNSSTHGVALARFQSVCRAEFVSSRPHLSAKLRTKMKFCLPSDDECLSRHQECSLSPWSDWGECSIPCGEGKQFRHRDCQDDNGDRCSADNCYGQPLVQDRPCNSHVCKGEWSCWSDWSLCSASCGPGFKFRTRLCQSPSKDHHYQVPCEGPEIDKQECTGDVSLCDFGWDSWSEWSVCTENNLQYRQRTCTLSAPFQGCQGNNMEKRMCLYNEINKAGLGELRYSTQQKCSGLHPYHMIIVGLMCFILGGVLCVVGLLWWQRRHRVSRHTGSAETMYTTLPGLKTKRESSQNFYMNPQELNVAPATLNFDPECYKIGSLHRNNSFTKGTRKGSKRDSGFHSNSLPRSATLTRTHTNFDRMHPKDF